MALLSINGLVKRFGGLVAVNDVSFKVGKGELLGLIGPNGAGKTTLFDLVCHFLKPDEGTVIFKNRDITNKPPYVSAVMGIGRTFQIVRPLLNLTVLDNALAGAIVKAGGIEEARNKGLEALKLVGLNGKSSLKAGSLNIAEMKKLELARAVASDPELLLLDEILAGLNASEIDESLKLLNKIHESDVTIIMIEHVMRAVMKLSQRIIVLQEGRVIADGSPKEIANDKMVIKAYLGERYLR